MQNLKIIAFLAALFLPIAAHSQTELTGLGVTWSNSLRQWTIYTDSLEGSLQPRWANDPTEWEYHLGDWYGTIKRKWRDDPSQWELTCSNSELLTARTIYANDYREWRITDNNGAVKWKQRYYNNANEWTLDDNESCGEFTVYMRMPNDPRDWNTLNKNNCLSVNAQLLLAFLSMMTSLPK
jgi:hypothetical protein